MGLVNAYARAKRERLAPLSCFICGVDSGPVRNFMILVIGGLVGATICVALWAWVTGRFRDRADAASLALTADEQERI